MENFWGNLNRTLDRFLTPAVKRIFLINMVVGLGLVVLGVFSRTPAAYAVFYLGLTPYLVIRGCIWQFITYMFIHVAPLHLLFNMAVLWFFAPELENRWGTRRFWRFFLIVGGVAGLIHFLATMVLLYAFHQAYELGPVIGASGALYGVMLAFAAYNPEAIVLVWGVFPIKVKYLMAIMAFLTFISTASPGQSSVSSLTHLSGLAVAYVWLANFHRDWDIRRWRWTR